VPARPTSLTLEPESQRRLASDLFNYVWTLLETPDRSERQSDLMVHAAHASRFFWEEIGEPVNHARGEWQIARVYAVLGRAGPAVHHGERCLEICREHDIGDFDLAYAYEALARAHGVAGARDAARRYADLARDAGDRIADADDRAHFAHDLGTLP